MKAILLNAHVAIENREKSREIINYVQKLMRRYGNFVDTLPAMRSARTRSAANWWAISSTAPPRTRTEAGVRSRSPRRHSTGPNSSNFRPGGTTSGSPAADKIKKNKIRLFHKSQSNDTWYWQDNKKSQNQNKNRTKYIRIQIEKWVRFEKYNLLEQFGLIPLQMGMGEGETSERQQGIQERNLCLHPGAIVHAQLYDMYNKINSTGSWAQSDILRRIQAADADILRRIQAADTDIY